MVGTTANPSHFKLFLKDPASCCNSLILATSDITVSSSNIQQSLASSCTASQGLLAHIDTAMASLRCSLEGRYFGALLNGLKKAVFDRVEGFSAEALAESLYAESDRKSTRRNSSH